MKSLLPILFSALICICGQSQALYEFPDHIKRSGLSSFENLNCLPNAGGKTNQGAKGNAFEPLEVGETKELLRLSGAGTIQRIWMTVNDRSPQMLRDLRLRMYWDGSDKPAVDAPLGDFFGLGLAQIIKFESALFSSPEGRSFNCFIPMPFRRGARITISNEGDKRLDMLFYDIDFVKVESQEQNMMYFHTYWKHERKPEFMKDYIFLPEVNGKGRYLGVNIGVNADAKYEDTWWGEGEVKIFLDEDQERPSYNGTGAEDYIGTGWGLGQYTIMYQGCTYAQDSLHQYAFYRYHIPDAIYFKQKIKAGIQMIGGGNLALVRKLMKAGVQLKPISVAYDGKFRRLLDEPLDLFDPSFPDGWVNFYRVDDYSSTAYFYFEKPVSGL